MRGVLGRRRRSIEVALWLSLIGACALLSAHVARGAFPGANGRIAFATNRGGGSHIFTTSPSGKHQKQVTDTPAFDFAPAYSPNGKSIVFVRASGPQPGIYRIRANGTHAHRLTSDTTDTDPAFSPNGKKIVFARGGQTPMKRGTLPPAPDIWIMRADGTQAHPLTEDPAEDAAPAFSPNGRRIAFTSLRDGDSEIFVMKGDGGHEHAITHNDAGDFDPNYAPDGGRITFSSDRAGSLDIFAMRSNGRHQRRLTTNHALDVLPCYSPNGKRIAFESTRGSGKGDIFVMRANGTHERSITRDPSGEIQPDWGPRP